MKRLWMLALCVLLLASHQADAVPGVVEEVVKNKEFFAEFTGYGDCYLFDVSRLDAGNFDERRIGLILLDPQGFEIRLVMEISNGETVYRDVFVPAKERRTVMRQTSLHVGDAVRLAKTATGKNKGHKP